MTEAHTPVARTRLRRLALALTRAALAVVAVHHGVLLAERLRDASISEPAVALRWILTAAVLGLAALFRRRRLSLLSGRSGLVFWLLVLLLHVGLTPIPATGVDSENLMVALPIGIAATLAVALAASRLAGRISVPRRLRPSPARTADPPPLRSGSVLALRTVPRPPPVS